MKIIFIEDLKGHGKKGDIKEVKDGFGKNFLIKNNYAVLLTEKSIEKLNEHNKSLMQGEKEKIKEANDLKVKLELLQLKFKVKVGEKDKVFGSVSTKQISEEVERKGYKINKKDIILNKPLTSLGIHNLKIELYREIYAYIGIELIK